MAYQIEELPNYEKEKLREQVMYHIEIMSHHELAIITQSSESLTQYVTGQLKKFARQMGYIISIPFSYAARIANRIADFFRGKRR